MMTRKFKEEPEKIKLSTRIDQNGKWEIILSVVRLNIAILCQSSLDFKVWSSFF